MSVCVLPYNVVASYLKMYHTVNQFSAFSTEHGSWPLGFKGPQHSVKNIFAYAFLTPDSVKSNKTRKRERLLYNKV